MTKKIRILGKIASINVRKVLWTCDELGLEYEREDWGKGYAPTQALEFLSLNPNALVPVLITEQGPLWESNTICRYLATRHNRTDLLPADPWQKAQVEKWMDWQATDLNGAWRYAFMALGRKDPTFDNPNLINESTANWNHILSILDKHLTETGPFICGDKFSLGDIVVGLSINRWLLTPIEKPQFSHILSYFKILEQREACQKWCRGIV